MNREIRFRGKSLETGKWVYGCLIHDKCGTMSDLKDRAFIAPTLPIENTYGHLWLTYMTEVDSDTVGEYAGCMDKNKQPIYEDDIVKDEKGNTYKVVFNGFGFGLDKSFQTLFNSEKYEVIGNVYDNPELLEKSDESEEQD